MILTWVQQVLLVLLKLKHQEQMIQKDNNKHNKQEFII